MKFDFTKPSSGLTYEIRNIADIAARLKAEGMEINYENIGDPISKGEKIPLWIKEILKDLLNDDLVFAYSPTKGVEKTREYLVKKNNARGGAQITKDDIIFFNGLGEAVACIYSMMAPEGRVILPDPTYSTHYLAEVQHSAYPAYSFRLDPLKNWEPDIHDLEKKVKDNRNIAGIMVVNPDNPTGHLYSEQNLKEIVRIAKENDLFLIFDELYNKITFKGKKTPMLTDIIGDVPGISMKSLSKEVPWPGARCGWIEVLNAGKDKIFDKFIASIYRQKMEEVCSTTFPQFALPLILEHPEFEAHLKARTAHYEKLSEIFYEELSQSPYLTANPAQGAFYAVAVFKEGILNDKQHLPVANLSIKAFIDEKLKDNKSMDKQFVYNMLASAGICVVPLTSFFTPLNGFRMTLLEKDEDKFRDVVIRVRENVKMYIESSR